MYLRKLLVGTVAATGLAGAANAADVVFMEPAPIAAPVEMAFDWSGFYLGVHGGYGWADADAEFSTGVDGALDYDLDGFFGGGQVGYNFVFAGGLLVGIEADYSFAGIDGSDSADVGLGTTVSTTQIDSIATVRGRLGYAMGRFLPYVTAGWAWADVERTASSGFLGDLADSQDYDGWTAGLGVEYAINMNWSAGFEYRYTDLGTETFDFSPPGLDTDLDLDLHTISMKLNYRF